MGDVGIDLEESIEQEGQWTARACVYSDGCCEEAELGKRMNRPEGQTPEGVVIQMWLFWGVVVSVLQVREDGASVWKREVWMTVAAFYHGLGLNRKLGIRLYVAPIPINLPTVLPLPDAGVLRNGKAGRWPALL